MDQSWNFDSDSFDDWIGIPPSPLIQAQDTIRGHEISVASFERDVDQICTGIDWTKVFRVDPPSPSYAPSRSSWSEETASSFGGSTNDYPPESPSIFTRGSDREDDPQSPLDLGSFQFQFGFPFPFGPAASPVDIFPHQSDQGFQPQPYQLAGVAGDGPRVGLEASEDSSLASMTPSDIDASAHGHSPPPKPVKRKRDSPTPELTVTVKRRRHQDTTPRFKCDHCEAWFARTHNLKVHVGSVHHGEKNFKCADPNCPKRFARKHDLTRHMQSKHTDLGSPRRKVKKE